jgi:serine protease AprX
VPLAASEASAIFGTTGPTFCVSLAAYRPGGHLVLGKSDKLSHSRPQKSADSLQTQGCAVGLALANRTLALVMKPMKITLSLLVLSAVSCYAGTDADLVRPAAGQTVEVIVQYAVSPTAEHHQRVTNRGGRLLSRYQHVPMAHYAVSTEALADLESNKDVLWISPNRTVKGADDYSDYSIDFISLNNYYLANSRAKAGGVGIAIIDSGINAAHPNFNQWQSSTSRIVYSQTFVGGDTKDEYGHGTHVAGIAAGVDNVISQVPDATRWFYGVAMDANIINLKVLDGNGTGSDATVIAGIDRAIQLKSTYNIRVINLSLGRPIYTSYKSDPLCQGAEQAWKAGIVVVVAAGNNGRDNTHGTQGYGTITAPGNDPYVITVGATNDKSDTDRGNDVIATYSSKGPTSVDHIAKPDLVAPGNRIVSYQAPGAALTTQFPANRLTYSAYSASGAHTASPYYFTLSGTSMASPFVAAAAAMLIDKDPTLTPDVIKARLMKTAWRGFPATMSTYDPTTNTTYTATHDFFTVGAGLVDSWSAYNSTDTAAGTAASPSTYYNAATKTVMLNLNSTSASSIIWGTGIIWGTSVIWGTSTVSGMNIIWGTSLIWGSSTVNGFSVIWGTSAPGGQAATGTESLSIAANGEN